MESAATDRRHTLPGPCPGGRQGSDHLGHQLDSAVVRAHQHAAGARKRGTCRTCGPWARTLARRPDHQAALGCGATAEAHVNRHRGGAAGRLPAVRGRPGPCPGSPAGAGQATHPAQAVSRGQGVRFPQETGALKAAGRRSPPRSTTASAMRWNAASIASRGTERLPFPIQPRCFGCSRPSLASGGGVLILKHSSVACTSRPGKEWTDDGGVHGVH